MPRDLSALFVEENVKTEQTRIFHLITVEVEPTTTTGTSQGDLTQISVADVSDIMVGQTIDIAGVGERKVTDISGSIVTLNSSTGITVTDAVISFNLLLNIVDSNYDIQYDGLTYQRFPVQFSETSISSDGTIDKAKISCANVSREIMYYVEQYDGLRNRRVIIRTVFEKFLDKSYTVAADSTVTTEDNPGKDVTAYVKDEFIIDNYTADENVVQFQLDPVIDLEVKLPRRRFLSDTCPWQYKGAECGSTSVLPTCAKTLSACKERNNAPRFGGFVGITGNRRLWL